MGISGRRNKKGERPLLLRLITSLSRLVFEWNARNIVGNPVYIGIVCPWGGFCAVRPQGGLSKRQTLARGRNRHRRRSSKVVECTYTPETKCCGLLHRAVDLRLLFLVAAPTSVAATETPLHGLEKNYEHGNSRSPLNDSLLTKVYVKRTFRRFGAISRPMWDI